jgi:hypothetical protein
MMKVISFPVCINREYWVALPDEPENISQTGKKYLAKIAIPTTFAVQF